MNQLRLFGGAVLESNGVPVTGRAAQRHRTALLALLATTRRRFRSRDQLITLLWPETDAERGRRMLSDSIYRINQALGGNVLVGPGEDVRMNRDQITSDVAAFEDAMEARDYPTAVSLYTGAFLDSFFLPGSPEFDRWMEIEREHYAQSMAKALEALALAASGARLVTEAVDHWQQLALLVPDDSRIAMELMRALEVAGNRAGALRHAKRHTELLRETLGFDPDRGVQELATTIASRNVPRDLSRNFARPVIRSIAKPVTKKAGPDAKTYDLYVQARFHWHKRLEESLLLSVSLFEQVLAREPMY
ncbi:MAG: BTAD domain-containing putative transcriptional regulator, partial [Gemmatimonadaceae bacterium]